MLDTTNGKFPNSFDVIAQLVFVCSISFETFIFHFKADMDKFFKTICICIIYFWCEFAKKKYLILIFKNSVMALKEFHVSFYQ